MLNIHSIETFGTQEGPGIRFVIFVQGCLLRCLYCHNPDSINESKNKLMSDEELIELIDKNKNYFGEKGGVTISGGEPLLQAKELLGLFKKLKKKSFHITLDTNGIIFNKDVQELLKYTDLVLLDIKHTDNKKHINLTGSSNINVLRFASYLEKTNTKFWVRHVLVPGYSDDDQDLENLGKLCGKFINLERVEILPYHTLGIVKWKRLGKQYKLDGVKPPGPDTITKAENILKKYVDSVYVRR